MLPNVVFIVVDSLRADKCFGNKKSAKTPNLDKLVDNGVLFSECYTSVAATGTAIGSLFSGKYPFRIGMSGEQYAKIDSTTFNFLELFKKNGYNVYGSIPKTLHLSSLGLTSAFESCDSLFYSKSRFSEGLDSEIIDLIQSIETKTPWFFYIHLLDLHWPIWTNKNFDNNEFGNTPYDRMISEIDNWLGQLLDTLDLENTLIVFTADHGEYVSNIDKPKLDKKFQIYSSMANKLPSSLTPIRRKLSSKLFGITNSKSDENSELSERMTNLDSHHLYDGLLHVPLIFSGWKINKKSISQMVRHVDTFPTIADLINLDFSNKSMDGQSLTPLLKNQSLEEFPIYIETLPRINKNAIHAIGVRNSNFKYFRDLHDPDNFVHLYDMINDCDEQKNIASSHLEVCKNLEQFLQDLLSNFTLNNKTDDSERTEIEDELRKLGYL